MVSNPLALRMFVADRLCVAVVEEAGRLEVVVEWLIVAVLEAAVDVGRLAEVAVVAAEEADRGGKVGMGKEGNPTHPTYKIFRK